MGSFDPTNRTLQLRLAYYGALGAGRARNVGLVQGAVDPEGRVQRETVGLAKGPLLVSRPQDIDLCLDPPVHLRLEILTLEEEATGGELWKTVLDESDGVVFIVDAQRHRLRDNLMAWADLLEHLRTLGKDATRMPIVFQYDKIDEDRAMDRGALEAAVNPEGYPAFEANSETGRGVGKCFSEAVRRMTSRAHGKLELESQGVRRGALASAVDSVTVAIGQHAAQRSLGPVVEPMEVPPAPAQESPASEEPEPPADPVEDEVEDEVGGPSETARKLARLARTASFGERVLTWARLRQRNQARRLHRWQSTAEELCQEMAAPFAQLQRAMELLIPRAGRSDPAVQKALQRIKPLVDYLAVLPARRLLNDDLEAEAADLGRCFQIALERSGCELLVEGDVTGTVVEDDPVLLVEVLEALLQHSRPERALWRIRGARVSLVLEECAGGLEARPVLHEALMQAGIQVRSRADRGRVVLRWQVSPWGLPSNSPGKDVHLIPG